MRKIILTLSVLGALLPAVVNSQSYPTQAIKLIIPFAAGGPSDVLARGFTPKLGESLGQPIIIENKPGAGANLAAEYVANSKSDGYTLFLMMVGTQAINETLYKKLNYNVVKDFSPISLVASSSLMLVANPSVPVKTVPELIAYEKANPGKVSFGSSGAGTPLHLAGELFNTQAGTNILHVPYKGAAPALTDVLGGQIQTAIVGTPAALPYVKSGKLTGLGVTSLKRGSNAPEIPAIAETLPKFEVELVYAIVAPASTPKAIVDKLNSQLISVLNNPEIKTQLNSKGFDVVTSTPAQTADYIKSEVVKWGPIVKKSGASAE
ncbi:tripartite tricarboxylate transporter substrate binding protein [Polynucleobacter sp. MWH-Aus1W21]|jgi:tripartite-type tricarboxylate transporter receptor subunit TctC|uniref:Bug family tripartite tricarboxylate transporter substrate binding protein n=1 Tax=Polynucleobacter sp. MWH-Aus1W21 TaxID=1855880 RepID=UPI001BFD8747|nr:tripartite tricarboxylate transporter substrate binding protein [Polynucleobacter sp. MWH-Aus1W21]QWD65301.1 tripartite tricarboxylate transporter substrate binding protein [Polynucleobacter sp. MWH-Aus1W21]